MEFFGKETKAGNEENLRGEKMIFVGIDPGVTGAVAFLSETSRILYATAVPTLKLTKSRRQALSRKEKSRKTTRAVKKEAKFPLRKFAVKL